MNPAASLASSDARAPDLRTAYRSCLTLCRRHYENFPVASLLVPASRRGAVAAVYAFARVADDFADEPGWDKEERLRLLADWRARLRRCRDEHGENPVFWALSDSIRRFDLPLEPFERLLTAFEMDVTRSRYGTFDELIGYCSHSANPVGELVLRIFREWTPERGRWSDALCTGLQLANFWQDVKIDGWKNRLYIPTDEIAKWRLSERHLQEGGGDPVQRRKLMAALLAKTWPFFHDSRPLCDDVSWRLRLELRLVWLGGSDVLRKIDAAGLDPWENRPRHGGVDWVRYLARALFWKKESA